MGTISAWHQTRSALQIRDPRSDRCAVAQERSVRIFQSARKIHRIVGVRSGTLQLERWRVDGIAPNAQLAEKSRQHLRSAPGLVASQSGGRKSPAELSRTHRDVAAVRIGNGLHAY